VNFCFMQIIFVLNRMFSGELGIYTSGENQTNQIVCCQIESGGQTSEPITEDPLAVDEPNTTRHNVNIDRNQLINDVHQSPFQSESDMELGELRQFYEKLKRLNVLRHKILKIEIFASQFSVRS
jgi:hypothetical protein